MPSRKGVLKPKPEEKVQTMDIRVVERGTKCSKGHAAPARATVNGEPMCANHIRQIYGISINGA